MNLVTKQEAIKNGHIAERYVRSGACSGLQHFSAMLRDDKPQDIYGIIAVKVNEVLTKRTVKNV